ncbi:MAG: hypothetical protein DMG43_06555 [Acidobacteria bacterium]|nr:MAG: hypothetical protein DMG43_06555 [Acidobacteriota bacterium]
MRAALGMTVDALRLGDFAGGFFEEFVDEGLASTIRKGIRCDQALLGAHGFCHCRENAMARAAGSESPPLFDFVGLSAAC